MFNMQMHVFHFFTVFSHIQDVTTEWEIHAMPTFLFINNGKQIDKVVGANKDELEKKIHHYATNQP